MKSPFFEMKVPENVIKNVFASFIACLLLLVAACNESDDVASDPTNIIKEGVFVDSVVCGLRYETETQSGITNVLGAFKYTDGETVRFALGDIVLGESRGERKLTPVDLVQGAVDEQNDAVTNIARFLLTMDGDGDWSNGIFISSDIRMECEKRIVDFDQSPGSFEQDIDVVNLLDTLNASGYFGDTTDRVLVSAEEAREHLKNNLGDTLTAHSETMDVMKDNILFGQLEASEPTGAPLTYEIDTEPTHGTISFFSNTTGNFIYTPDWNYFGSDSFSFRASDGINYSNTAQVSINISWIEGQPPVASSCEIFIDEDTVATGTLTAIATDNNTLTYEIETGPVNGDVSITDSAAGTYIYTPDPNFFGTDSFFFFAFDGVNYSNSVEITIYVGSMEDVPVAWDRDLEVDEDTSASGFLFAADNDNDPLTFEIVDASANGSVVITDEESGAFTYTPTLNYYGDDSFTFMVYDGGYYSNTAQVSIIINRTDGHSPVASDGTLAADEDTDTSGTLSAADADNDSLTFEVVDAPANGAVSITDTATGAYTYRPEPDFYGSDSFTFRVFDGINYSNTAEVAITVNIVDGNPPCSHNDTLMLSEDVRNGNGVATGTLRATDLDDDALTFEIVDAPQYGAVSITDTATGEYTYKPDPDFPFEDRFTFRVFDGCGYSNVAEIVVY